MPVLTKRQDVFRDPSAKKRYLCFLPELEAAACRRREMRWTTYELLASEREELCDKETSETGGKSGATA